MLLEARSVGELVEQVRWRIQVQLCVTEFPVTESVFEQLMGVHAVAASRPPQCTNRLGVGGKIFQGTFFQTKDFKNRLI